MPCALCLVPCALCLVIQGDAEGPLTISQYEIHKGTRERGNLPGAGAGAGACHSPTM